MPLGKNGEFEILLRFGSNRPQQNERPPIWIFHLGCNLLGRSRKTNNRNPVPSDPRCLYLQLCVWTPDPRSTIWSSIDGTSEDEVPQRRGWGCNHPRRPKRSQKTLRDSLRGGYTAEGDGTSKIFRRSSWKMAKLKTGCSPRLQH